MKNVALYVRVSTEEQKKHGISVDSQIQALKDYANNQDYNIVGIYNDAGISARKRYTKRPAILKLIQECQAHKVDLILFTKLDRWFRSVADYYEVQAQLDACNVKWRAIWEDYETETSSGVFKVNIMLSIAQAEADRTSERIRAVFDYQRSQGKYVGDVPFGYIKKDGKVIKDPEKSHLVDLAFETYLETHSGSAVLKALQSAGHNMSRSGIQRLFTNTAYYGDCNGYPCEPYITKEIYNHIVEKRSSNASTREKSQTYIFSGLCVCSLCNHRMRANTKKENGIAYKGYFCTGNDTMAKHDQGVYVSERKLEKFMLENIESIINAYNVEIETNSKEADQESIDRNIKKLEGKLERIGVRYEEGDLTTQEYKEKRKAIQFEIASLNSLNPSTKIELPEGWQAVYNDLDQEHKRAFWYSTIKEIHLSPRMNPVPQVYFLD